MFSFIASRLFGFNAHEQVIDLPPVEIHDVETSPEKRLRTLKHLLRANHANHSILYHNLQFHNHTPHLLGSAYIFGAAAEQLNIIYETGDEELEPWQDSPGEITQDDWRDFFGSREYQRAYIDFFEDQLVSYRYDWKKLLHDYLFSSKEPLFNSLVSGLGHPLIHLGYAYELSSRTIGIEALALATCSYDFIHKYLDNPSYTTPPTYTGESPLSILEKIYNDKRFDELFDHQGSDNIRILFKKKEDIVLEHWNAWEIKQPKEQFELSQQAAVCLLVATHENNAKYDFFLVHLLTTSHAVRILLPLIPPKFHIPLVRQWWLFTVATYIAQLRPAIRIQRIKEYDLNGRDWKFVANNAIHSQFALDAHYVKGLRAIKEAARTWGDDSKFYLKAAVKFAEEFNHWGGFGR